MSEKKPTVVNNEAQTVAFPVIETARLRLRMFRADDLDSLAALFADPDVMRHVADGKPADRETAEKAIASTIAHWERHGLDVGLSKIRRRASSLVMED